MRIVVAVGISLVVIVVLAGTKFAQISSLIKFGKAAQAAGPPPEAVGTAVVKSAQWESLLESVGSVAAARGVTISNEVPGVVHAIRFDSGAKVHAGQVLVELDASVERAQLASLQARRDLATTSVSRTRRLEAGGASTKAQLDADEAQVKTVSADARALEAEIDKKTIRAPFGGKLGIRSVNLGQYLNPGTAVTVLESLDADYIDFTVPQQQLARVPVGTAVRITLPGTEPPRTLDGKIAAVDPNVDPVTRAVKLRASVQEDGAKGSADELRPGMFVNVSVVLPERANVVFVPSTSIARAPYGNSIYVVEDKKDEEGHPVTGPGGKPAKIARQQFVRLGVTRGDFVAVDEGVTAGQEVVVLGAFKLRNGAPIFVNNEIKLSPSQTPNPQNR
ncbi:MAG TPA: efflux RND transporter periplasmic adaptor subunit [Polyangia bacterium]|jgi:membrane fusion protein (multidrug efflux system)|nr:efflux RND transporter periplasmic adaptor subunit [Polyangia bacterium]